MSAFVFWPIVIGIIVALIGVFLRRVIERARSEIIFVEISRSRATVLANLPVSCCTFRT